MKKILKGIMVLSLCLVTSIGSVKANANPGGGKATGGVGGDCRIKGMCNYNNDNFLALRAIFAYVDNGKIVESYDPFYFVVDRGNYLRDNVGIDSKYIYTASEWGATDISLSSKTRYKQASAALKEYFDDKKEDLNNDKEINVNLKKFIVKSVNTKNKYSDYKWKEVNEKILKQKESQNANKNIKKAAKRGWRILIEPVFNYTYTSPRPRLWTVKEYAYFFGDENANEPVTVNGITKNGIEWIGIQDVRPIIGKYGSTADRKDAPQSQYLFTTFKDVGIPAPVQNGKWDERRKACINISLKKLGADMTQGTKITHGCGLNIYDVGYQNEPDTCYEITYDKDKVTCEDNDTYNVGSYSTSIEETECKKGTIANNNKTGKWSKWGVKVAEISGCKLYVKESGRVKLPGGVTKTETLGKDIVDGGYFAWPARYNASKGLKLEMKTSFLFRRIGKDKCTEDVLKKLYSKGYDYAKDAVYEARLTAGNNLPINNSSLVIGNKRTKVYREEAFKNRDKYTFKVTTVAYLQINQNINRLQNKGTGAVKNYNASDAKNNAFTDRGEGVISLRKNSGTKGTLKLTNIKLGKNGKYTINDYACPYNIKSSTCVCPPDSTRAGENISEELKAVTGTCEQLQKELCYKKYYCYFKKNRYDITECVIKAKKELNLNSDDAVAKCSKEEPRCHTIPCPNTNYNIPDDEWEACINSEGKTETDCEEELCKKVCYYMNKQTGKVEERDISGCMANGLSETTCTQSICHSPCEGCKGLCDNWTEKTSSSGNLSLTGTGKNFDSTTLNCSIDINACYKSCVKGKLGLKDSDSLAAKLNATDGKAEGDIKEALETCKKEVTCGTNKNQNPDNSMFKNVMFRSMDLQYPFPGSNGKTRKPGSNWSVESDVKDYITNARGAEGYALYNKKPLYTIKLDQESIRKIRKYNKDHAYTDYSSVICKGDNGTACVSTFLHSGEYVKIDNSKSVGVCSSLSKASGKDDFNKCYKENN